MKLALFALFINTFILGAFIGKFATQYELKQKIQYTGNYDTKDLEKGLRCLEEEDKYLKSIGGN